MHFIHTVVRFYPYWALILAIILVELGIFFKRRGQMFALVGCWIFSVLLLSGIGFYFYYRGDLHSDRWVRDWLETPSGVER